MSEMEEAIRLAQATQIHQICRNCECFDIGTVNAAGEAECYLNSPVRPKKRWHETCLHWSMDSDLAGEIVDAPSGSA